jgi:hypothetical protein
MEAAAVAQAASLIVQSCPMGDITAAGGLRQDRIRARWGGLATFSGRPPQRTGTTSVL